MTSDLKFLNWKTIAIVEEVFKRFFKEKRSVADSKIYPKNILMKFLIKHEIPGMLPVYSQVKYWRYLVFVFRFSIKPLWKIVLQRFVILYPALVILPQISIPKAALICNPWLPQFIIPNAAPNCNLLASFCNFCVLYTDVWFT